ncbi:hypothetical protein [Antarctobacter sp.]|uniref:hypothetical protein n=1 Tax=Antarctobacter sp. TaxID=1872577 RepID=UPI002B26E6D6|nr:hypothetical protein [Antarctobacter sp.]
MTRVSRMIAGAIFTAAGTLASAQTQVGPSPCDFETETKDDVIAMAKIRMDELVKDGLILSLGPLKARYERKGSTPLPNYIYVPEGKPRITIGFAKVVDASMSVEALQDAVSFVANNGYPVPGLDAYTEWDIHAQSPSSSTDHGIQILSSSPGQMRLKVSYPRFFALYGIDMRSDVFHWADVSTPASCFFQIRRDFAGEVEFLLEIEGW